MLLGSNGLATADRLAWFLAHSGAVVFLHVPYLYSYTFSSRLVPYVHYIPISYTGGDIVEKVQWLRENDVIAQKIIQNAQNFASSYLRLEDHYCYMATALEAIGGLCNSSNSNSSSSSSSSSSSNNNNGLGSDVTEFFHDSGGLEL